MARYLLVLVALAAPAQAEPCSTTAKPLVDVEHHYGVNTPNDLGYAFHVLDSGAWTLLDRDPSKGVLVDASSGCLDASALKDLRAKLATATWRSRHKDQCTPPNSARDEYSVRGKQVWIARSCGSQALDGPSAKAIATIDAVMNTPLAALFAVRRKQREASPTP